MGIGKLKRHKSPGFDEIPSKLIKAGVWTIRFEIHKLTNLLSKFFNFNIRRLSPKSYTRL